MRFDKSYLIFSLVYALLGMGAGSAMAASHNHGQLVTHAHILLVGFVVSFVYAIIHKLWLTSPNRVLASVQLALHQLGGLGMFIGLALLYGAMAPPERVEPLLAVSSQGILLAALLMLVMVLRNKGADAETA